MNVVWAPEDDRVMNSTPPLGVTSRMTCAELEVSDCRNITPAFAYWLLFCLLDTSATIVPSPLRGCETNWKASALPQMSAPEPLTVNTPLAYVALPDCPVDPTS